MERSFACSWTIQRTVLHCLIVSTLYVAVLYVLIPSKVRTLPREHITHVTENIDSHGSFYWLHVQVSHRIRASFVGSFLGIALSFVLLPVDECYAKSFAKVTGLSFNTNLLSPLLMTTFLMVIFYMGSKFFSLCSDCCFIQSKPLVIFQAKQFTQSCSVVYYAFMK